MLLIRYLALFCACLFATGQVFADIKIGIIASLSGPAALIGTAQKNTVSMFPTRIGAHKAEYIVMDDATDPVRTLAALDILLNKHKVDAIIGPSSVPSALALLKAMDTVETPLLMTVVSADLPSTKMQGFKWSFKSTQNDALLAEKVVIHMQWHRVNSIGFIGFNDAYGQKWLDTISEQAQKAFIEITASTFFNRTDTSVEEQILTILSTQPDAVLIAASGTPALLPQAALRQQGFKGPIYQTHGVASREFIRLGGKQVEGVLIASDPVLVADELSNGNPVKSVAQAFSQAYEQRFGAGSASAYSARIYDAGLMLQTAIPRAMKRAVPGTQEFRRALRSELEQIKELVGTQGVLSMSPLNHDGMDRRSCIMMRVENGRWVLVKE